MWKVLGTVLFVIPVAIRCWLVNEDRMARVQALRRIKRHQTGSNNGRWNRCLVGEWDDNSDYSNRLHESACCVPTHSGESSKAKRLGVAD